MANVYTTLHRKGDTTTLIYPNIVSQNIPNFAVTKTKLAVQVQNDIDGKTTLAEINTKILDALVNGIDGFGFSLSYTYTSNVYAFTIANDDMTLRYSSGYDIVEHNYNYQHFGNHYFGVIELELQEQFTSGNVLLTLAEQREYPSNDIPLVAFKNGSLVSASIDTDGQIRVNAGLDVADVVVIKLEWWV